MSIKVGAGTTIDAVYKGSTSMDRVYVGTNPIFPHEPLTTGLISCWEFDELLGTTAFDAHAGNDLDNVNCTINQTGKINKSYDLNGTTARCKVDAVNALSPQSAHSVSMWFKRNGDGNAVNAGALMSRYYSTTGNRIYVVYLYVSDHATLANNIRALYYDTSNVACNLYYAPSSNIWNGNWKNVIYTRSGDAMKIYVDGVQVASGNGGGNGSMKNSTDANCDDFFGATARSTTTPDNYMDMNLDQTAVWSKALTQSEIDKIYNRGRGLKYSNW